MSFNLSSWSIRNPTPGILLFVLLTIAGLMGFAAMKVQAFPDMTLPEVTVTASLPGASPSQLESEVARKIENALATVQGVKHISSTLGESTANIAVSFQLEKPPQEAVEDVRDAVAIAQRVVADPAADEYSEILVYVSRPERGERRVRRVRWTRDGGAYDTLDYSSPAGDTPLTITASPADTTARPQPQQ